MNNIRSKDLDILKTDLTALCEEMFGKYSFIFIDKSDSNKSSNGYPSMITKYVKDNNPIQFMGTLIKAIIEFYKSNLVFLIDGYEKPLNFNNEQLEINRSKEVSNYIYTFYASIFANKQFENFYIMMDVTSDLEYYLDKTEISYRLFRTIAGELVDYFSMSSLELKNTINSLKYIKKGDDLFNNFSKTYGWNISKKKQIYPFFPVTQVLEHIKKEFLIHKQSDRLIMNEEIFDNHTFKLENRYLSDLFSRYDVKMLIYRLLKNQFLICHLNLNERIEIIAEAFKQLNQEKKELQLLIPDFPKFDNLTVLYFAINGLVMLRKMVNNIFQVEIPNDEIRNGFRIIIRSSLPTIKEDCDVYLNTAQNIFRRLSATKDIDINDNINQICLNIFKAILLDVDKNINNDFTFKTGFMLNESYLQKMVYMSLPKSEPGVATSSEYTLRDKAIMDLLMCYHPSNDLLLVELKYNKTVIEAFDQLDKALEHVDNLFPDCQRVFKIGINLTYKRYYKAIEQMNSTVILNKSIDKKKRYEDKNKNSGKFVERFIDNKYVIEKFFESP